MDPIFISGTVALCAGCDLYASWGAVIVGAMSGPIFMVIKYILLRWVKYMDIIFYTDKYHNN